MIWRAVLAIARKDLLDAVKNLYVLSALVSPIVLSLLFKLAFGGSGQGLASSVVVYDPGGSRLVSGLRATAALSIVEVASQDQLYSEVDRQGLAGLDVPLGFDAAVKSGARPDLTVYLNQGRGGGEIAAFRIALERELRALAGQEPPVRLNEVPVGGGVAGRILATVNLEGYLLIMLLVLCLAMSGTFAVPILLVEEKEKHTLSVLLVSPASAADVVIGKGLVGLVYCLLGSGVLIALNHGWRGNWPLTALAILVGSAFCVLLGLLIGGLFRTMSQVNTWTSLLLIILVLPTWFTLAGQATLFATVLRAVPTFYLAEALGAALSGSDNWGQYCLDIAIVGACAAAAMAGVVWMLRREEI